MRLSACLILVGLAATPGLAQQSNAARYLLEQEIESACMGPGRIDPAGLIERDLTGDGRDDLIISHEAIQCTGGTGLRSLSCGMQVCLVRIFVREGDLLQPAADMLGGGVSVGAGTPPVISMFAHGGAQRGVRWTGSGFE